MRITIGSKNRAKVEALQELVGDYECLRVAQVVAFEVDSGVADQPKSMRETVRGAKNRAKGAWRRGEEKFSDCRLSFGLESGLIKAPGTKTGYLDTCVCAIWDGRNFHLGFSSCFEYPRKVMKLVLEDGLDVTRAFNKAGFSKNPELGSAEGAIGILTKGRVLRKDYTQQALRAALIHLENEEWY